MKHILEPGNQKDPFPQDTLKHENAMCTRCEYRGPVWVARVHYVRVRVVNHPHVHSPVVTVHGFELIPLGPQAFEAKSQSTASSSTKSRLMDRVHKNVKKTQMKSTNLSHSHKNTMTACIVRITIRTSRHVLRHGRSGVVHILSN